MNKKQNFDDREVVLEIGGKPEEATVSISFFGDDLDPDELTQLLKCEPTHAYKKGHIVKKNKQTIKTGT